MKIQDRFYGALRLRSFERHGEWWFSASDAAVILGSGSTARLLNSVLSSDIAAIAVDGQGTWAVSLEGLLRAAHRVRSMDGPPFCRWLSGQFLAAQVSAPVVSEGAVPRALSSGQFAAALGRPDDARLQDRLISVANKLRIYAGVDLWLGQAGKVLWFDPGWLEYFLAAYFKDPIIDRHRAAFKDLQRLVRDNPEQLLTREQAEQEVEMAFQTRV